MRIIFEFINHLYKQQSIFMMAITYPGYFFQQIPTVNYYRLLFQETIHDAVIDHQFRLKRTVIYRPSQSLGC